MGAESGERPKCILVIEDEPDLVRGLRAAFSFEGFEVRDAATGETGISLAEQCEPHLIILDLMLPDRNGYQICTVIRRRDPNVPIVMLSARSQEHDKIRGLEVGADDYVTKPFSVGELVARVKAIFRRLERESTGPSSDLTIEIGPACVDLKKHLLTRNRRSESLSFYEIELLRLLYDRLEQPVSRDEILEKIWGLKVAPTNRTVDNVIVKLRKKIEDDPKSPKHIQTVYGLGYKLMP